MRLNILIMLLLGILLLIGCATQVIEIDQDKDLVQRPENEGKIVLPEPKQENVIQKNPEKCPDGVWDEAEQRDPDLCQDDNPNLKSTSRTAHGSGEMKEGHVFIPDTGIRKNDASNPGIYKDQNGIFHLYYRDKVATSTDGLIFSEGVRVSDTNDFRGIKLPDGTWRRYYWDERGRTPSTNYGLKSKSSKDGVYYIGDPGYRYQLHESDHGTAGIHEFFVDNSGGVVLLYIGDLLGLNNIRRAYSKDNGWTFSFDKGNVLGDGPDGKPGSFIDHKVVALGDGKRRLYAVRQGSIYSFISNDDGKTFVQEPGVRLAPSDFAEFDIVGFSDPVFIKLQDGRWRVYTTAFLRGYAPEQEGSQKEIIVSATTQRQQIFNQTQSQNQQGGAGQYQSWQDGNSQAQNPNATSCPGDISGILTYPIVEDQYLERISPLGHVKADDRMHVIPIPHIYYVNSKSAQVFSPADLWLEGIDRLTQIDSSGKVIWSDFNIYMIPCKEIKIEFDHVRNLSDAFMQMLNESEEHCSTDPPTVNRRYETCRAEIKKKIKLGDPIGWVGGYGNYGLDVAAYDSRIKNPFISPERYRFPSLQGICFLDLYSGRLKDSLYDKIIDPDGRKKITETRCGRVAQDVLGTIQGEWFIGNISADQAEREGKVLSIVHFELEPPSGIIATSGTLVPSPRMLAFAPRHEGFINREPSEIKDSNIYCFQHEQSERIVAAYSSATPFTGRILIQLIDAKTLKAEYQEKSCDESFNFNLPIIYER